MAKRKISDGVPRLLDGMTVTRWLRPYILRSILSLKFMPKINGELTDEIEKLNDKDRHALIGILIETRSKTSAESDFWGIVGIPALLGFLAIYASLDLPFEMIFFYILALLIYLFVYYYHRLMLASLESLLSSLRIESEYFRVPYIKENEQG